MYNNRFVYQYDKLNRLTNGTSTGTVMSEVLTYDDMGNIKTLRRDGGTPTTYAYTGNRLTTLTGGISGSYTYDLNGNATKDRTGIAFSYNHLNLPKSATRSSSGSNPAVSVQYLYDGQGTKLQRKSTVGTTVTQRDYVGGIEYNKEGSGSSAIEMIHTEEGYLQRSSSNVYTYHYNLTDHLGNVRATLQRATATTGTVIQKHDYYPFGKSKAIVTAGINRYLYNGKELQDALSGGTHALGSSYTLEGQYDYGARFYDPEIGRWNVVDPLSEQMRKHSPYNYAFNNPIRFIDPDGMRPDDYTVTDEGKIELVRRTDDNFDRLIKVDDSGTETSTSIKVDKGVLRESPKSVLNDSPSKMFDDYTIMQTSNNTQAVKLFEFLSNNTSVEWGKISMTGGSIISSSHDKRTERSSGSILLSLMTNGVFMNSNNFIMTQGTVLDHVHSHPNSPTLGASGDYGNGGSKMGDRHFAKLIEAIDPNLPLRIYHIKTGGVYFRYNSRQNLIR